MFFHTNPPTTQTKNKPQSRSKKVQKAYSRERWGGEGLHETFHPLQALLPSWPEECTTPPTPSQPLQGAECPKHLCSFVVSSCEAAENIIPHKRGTVFCRKIYPSKDRNAQTEEKKTTTTPLVLLSSSHPFASQHDLLGRHALWSRWRGDCHWHSAESPHPTHPTPR
mgnify:CR=1 FL=1